MTTNRHLARGIAIVDDKKVFIIGYAVGCKDKWYVIDHKDLESFSFYDEPDDLTLYHAFTKVISEPDPFYKTINGIDYFENDIAEVKVRNYGSGARIKEVVINENGLNFGNWNYNEVEVLRKVGNTYGIADGIKEGEDA